MKIQIQPGWQELEDDADIDMRGLWGCVGQGDVAGATALLEEAGYEFDRKPKDVYMISVPDDMLGERYRIFVRP